MSWEKARARIQAKGGHLSHTALVNDVLIAIGSLPGVHAWKNATGAMKDDTGRLIRYGDPGSPDILAIVRVGHDRGWSGVGQFVGFECKTGRGRLSWDQEVWRDACQQAGGRYVQVRDVSDALQTLAELGVPLSGQSSRRPV